MQYNEMLDIIDGTITAVQIELNNNQLADAVQTLDWAVYKLLTVSYNSHAFTLIDDVNKLISNYLEGSTGS
jgi:hypothetical protein